MSNIAVVNVDWLYDFTRGSLKVVGALEALPVANSIIKDAEEKGYLIVFVKEQHPPDHISFASNNDAQPFTEKIINGKLQAMWPDHCVIDTPGAEFDQDLYLPKDFFIVEKGGDSRVDSYSAFFDNNKENPTILDSLLANNNIDKIEVTGLAGDFCVDWTIQHALELGYKVAANLASIGWVYDSNKEGTIDKWKNQGVILYG